jgi:hypothetical protein
MPRPTGAIKRKWELRDCAATAERKWDSAGNTARCSALRQSGLQRCTRWSAACTVLQHAMLRCNTINALAAPCLQRVGDGRRLVRDVRDHACAVPAKESPTTVGTVARRPPVAPQPGGPCRRNIVGIRLRRGMLGYSRVPGTGLTHGWDSARVGLNGTRLTPCRA